MPLTLGYTGRTPKPRERGRTMMIDTGLPLDLFRDVIRCHHPYVDAVKFGWATALLTEALPGKIDVLRAMNIDCWFGGTFFEIAWQEGKLGAYIAWMRRLGITHVEISDGAFAIDPAERMQLIREFSLTFTVTTEIGKKEADVEPDPAAWIATIRADLSAGARSVILEGRESGTAGLYGGDGAPRGELVEALLAARLPIDRLIFETPQKSQQVWLLTKLGPEINLGNIAWGDLIPLETLRRGLRADTAGRMRAHDDPYATTRRAG